MCCGAVDIKIIRITEFRRIARTVRLLEIDTVDDRLLVFTRWDLGTDPLDVLDALTAAGYAGALTSRRPVAPGTSREPANDRAACVRRR